jgi:hypothetical protein
MLVIVGLTVLLVAAIVAIVAIVGLLSNAVAAHPPTDFSVFGYHLTGSAGTLFLFGIAVGAVASFGLLLLAGARPPAPPDEGTTLRRRIHVLPI